MSQWTSSFSLIGPTGATGPVGPLHAATDYGSYLFYNANEWIVGSTSISLGTDAGLTGQGSNAVAIGYKAGEINQPAGSIILNAGATGLNGLNAGLYIKPVREVLPADQFGVFYDTQTNEVIHNSIISLSSPNTVVVSGNIVPNSSIAYTLGTSSLRYKDAFFGPGSINLAGPSNASATIGTDAQGMIYTQSGFATPFINIGPEQLTPQSVGGWQIGPTGTQGTSSFMIAVQEQQANGNGLTGPAYSLINPVAPAKGGIITVDDTYGNDTYGHAGTYPFKTINAAVNALDGYKTIVVNPGNYTLTGPITLPANTSIRGVSLQTCKISYDVSADATMITMGENTRIQDLSIELTSSSDVNLTGVRFPGQTAQTAKVRDCVITVDNSSVSSTTKNVIGIFFNGSNTMGPNTFSFNSLKSITLNVYSKSTGVVRGVLCVNTTITTFRDINIFTSSFTTGTSNTIAIETLSTAQVELRTCSISGTTADISQTGGNIQVGPGVDLINRNANAKSFTTSVYPTTLFYGVKGNFSNMTANDGWLWPGTVGIAKSVGGATAYPDTGISYFSIQQPAILYGMTTDIRNSGGAANSSIFTVYISSVLSSVAIPTSFSIGYGSNQSGLVTYSNVSYSLKTGDTISLYLSTTGTLNQNPFINATVQLDLF